MKNPFFFPILSAALAGLYFISTESFIRYFGDLALAMTAVITVSGGLFLLPFTKKAKGIRLKQMIKILLGSVTIYALPYFLLFKAIKLAGSSKVAFLSQTELVFIVILAAIFLKETVRAAQAGGIALVLAGAMAMNFDPGMGGLSLGMGELYAVLVALSFATGITIISDVIKEHDPILITALQMLCGGLILTPFIAGGNHGLTAGTAAVLVPVGILLALTWLTYNMGLKKMGSSKTSLIYSTKSFFTFVIGYAAAALMPGLGLKIPRNTIPFLTGGVLIFLGIIIYETCRHGGKREIRAALVSLFINR